MGLESGDYISDLNQAWPLPSDKRRQGDDHFRLLKRVLKNSFPNVNGAVTSTLAELNSIGALTALVEALEAPGSIKMWDIINKPDIPDGWVPCDGRTVVGYGTVPDMRDRFVVCEGSDYAAGDTGGDDTPLTEAGGAHAHGGATASHVLTTPEIPSHTHTVGIHTFVDELDNGTGATYMLSGGSIASGATGGGGGHTHDITEEAAHTHEVDVRPRYYVTVFIVKVE